MTHQIPSSLWYSRNFDTTLWNEIFELAKDTGDVDEDNSVAGKDFCILAFDTKKEAAQLHTKAKAAHPHLQAQDIETLADTDCNAELTHTLYARIPDADPRSIEAALAIPPKQIVVKDHNVTISFFTRPHMEKVLEAGSIKINGIPHKVKKGFIGTPLHGNSG
jgi:hypothetical protein